jgi:hypothetical protein
MPHLGAKCGASCKHGATSGCGSAVLFPAMGPAHGSMLNFVAENFKAQKLTLAPLLLLRQTMRAVSRLAGNYFAIITRLTLPKRRMCYFFYSLTAAAALPFIFRIRFHFSYQSYISIFY